MSDCTPTKRRFVDALQMGRGASVIKAYWQSQLRSPESLLATRAVLSPRHGTTTTTATSTATTAESTATSATNSAAFSRRTPSTARSNGLTESTERSSGTAVPLTRSSSLGSFTSSSARRRCLREAALSAERRHGVDFRERFGALAKPLFQSYLLPQFEAHESCPTLTVIFDLDETLVNNRNAYFSSAILRPYCLHMLNALRHMRGLEVVLWTASTKETASQVVGQLSESGLVFDEVIYRSDLWFTEPVHTKDLRLLGRDMDRLLIIDNAANCCKLNPQSAVLVEDFHGLRGGGDDATLVNVYYIIERVFQRCQVDIAVRDTVRMLEAEGHLCGPLELTLPESWKHLPLREIAPLKIPPHGHFTLARRAALDDKIMSHWTP